MIPTRRRKGIAVLDAAVGFAVLSAALVLGAQSAIWLVGERRQVETRQQAIETVAGVLESARACSPEGLDSKWAEEERGRLLELLAGVVDEPNTSIGIEPEPERAGARRVTVELTWKQGEGKTAPPIRVTGLFAGRKQGGSKPCSSSERGAAPASP